LAKNRTEKITELGMIAEMPDFAGKEVLLSKASRSVAKSYGSHVKKKKKKKRRKRKRA